MENRFIEQINLPAIKNRFRNDSRLKETNLKENHLLLPELNKANIKTPTISQIQVVLLLQSSVLLPLAADGLLNNDVHINATTGSTAQALARQKLHILVEIKTICRTSLIST
jgi:N-acetyl-gamma-glutamyl-phosphate reductase